MRYSFVTGYMPCTLVVPVRSLIACTIRLKVYDPSQPATYLTNRFLNMPVPKDDVIYVPMPISPKAIVIEIFDDAVGDRPETSETSFDTAYTTKGMKKKALRRHMSVVSEKSDVQNFIKFAQKFCYNAGAAPIGMDYFSDGKMFTCRYSDILKDDSGQESSTPARINKYTKIIEASKRKLVPLTVPERLVIMFHEFSHLWLNEDEYNELEADLNGLTIYLGLGYSKFEALTTFIDIFYNAQTNENFDRMMHIEDFVQNFDTYFSDRKI